MSKLSVLGVNNKLLDFLGMKDANKNGVIDAPSDNNYYQSEGFIAEADVNYDGRLVASEIKYYASVARYFARNPITGSGYFDIRDEGLEEYANLDDEEKKELVSLFKKRIRKGFECYCEFNSFLDKIPPIINGVGKDAARTIFSELVGSNGYVSLYSGKNEPLAQIVRKMAETGLIDEAYKYSLRIGKGYWRVYAWEAIIDVLINGKDEEKAGQLLLKSDEIVKQISDANAYLMIGRTFFKYHKMFSKPSFLQLAIDRCAAGLHRYLTTIKSVEKNRIEYEIDRMKEVGFKSEDIKEVLKATEIKIKGCSEFLRVLNLLGYVPGLTYPIERPPAGGVIIVYPSSKGSNW